MTPPADPTTAVALIAAICGGVAIVLGATTKLLGAVTRLVAATKQPAPPSSKRR